jgi:hypothetical protein
MNHDDKDEDVSWTDSILNLFKCNCEPNAFGGHPPSQTADLVNFESPVSTQVSATAAGTKPKFVIPSAEQAKGQHELVDEAEGAKDDPALSSKQADPILERADRAEDKQQLTAEDTAQSRADDKAQPSELATNAETRKSQETVQPARGGCCSLCRRRSGAKGGQEPADAGDKEQPQQDAIKSDTEKSQESEPPARGGCCCCKRRSGGKGGQDSQEPADAAEKAQFKEEAVKTDTGNPQARGGCSCFCKRRAAAKGGQDLADKADGEKLAQPAEGDPACKKAESKADAKPTSDDKAQPNEEGPEPPPPRGGCCGLFRRKPAPART